MRNYTKIENLFTASLALFPYFTVFVASLYPPSDLDLGWHLKYGEYFFTHGAILRDNTFSVMMPDYKWVNHSWGTDILTYAIFYLFGFFGLSVAAALVVTLTFFFFSRAARLSLWEETLLFPALLILLYPLNAVSFRSQLLSLLFLGILFYIFSLYRKQEPKKLYVAVPLFLVWANVHGEFILGLAVFFLWIVLFIGLEMYNSKLKISTSIFQQTKNLSLIFLLTVVATLINPFGVGIYTETFKYFGNPLQNYITEWTPIPPLSVMWWLQIGMVVLLFLGILRLYHTDLFKEKSPFIFLACIFIVLPFWAKRYSWPAYYIMLPVLYPLARSLRPNKEKFRLLLMSGLLIATFVVVVILKFPFTNIVNYSWDEYCQRENVGCSPSSARFLAQHHLTYNLFSDYGWGGWLIWNYPSIKPTIDGRMPFWQDEHGYSGFKEYLRIEQNVTDIDKSQYDVVYISPTKPIYWRMEQLVKEGKWELVYQDRYAGIFVRKT